MNLRPNPRRVAALLACVVLVCPELALTAPTPQKHKGKNSAVQEQVSVDPKQARKLVEQGEKLEAAGKLEEALRVYDEAARFAPNEAAVVGRGAALRSRIVREHVEMAERLALENGIRPAVEELNKALAIDKGNTIVQQRVLEMKAMDDTTPTMRPEAAAGLPLLKPEPGRKNVALRGDTKTVYQQLTAAYGLKVAFDPDLSPHSVRLALEDVDFFTAASLLAAQSKTFWRVIDESMMFIVADTPDKRRQYGVELEQTFPLRAAAAPEELSELLRILRDITGATHIELDSKSHSITMRDTPERLLLASRVIQEAEQARGELMLDVDLLEVNRDAARNLGIQFPTKAQLFSIPVDLLSQLRQAKDLNSLLSLLAGVFGGAATAGAFSLSSAIPPFVVVGGGKTTFLLTLPGTAAQFSDALTTVQSGRKVLMRAQQGKPATFFVGDRFPVTLSLLSGSIGSVTPNAGGAANPFLSASYDVGGGPVSLVAADFRNNGLQDLATVNEIDNSFSILLNQGGDQAGTFVTPATTTSLGTPRTAAPAVRPQITSDHLTNSGFHDLLITDPTANTVRIFLSNGDGTFKEATGSPISVLNQPSAIVTGDFNNDGNVDFAVTSFSASEVSVFLGDGTGAFTPATNSPIALPSGVLNPVAMVSGDFDGKGDADLAIVANNNATSQPGELVVLLGQGNGTFVAAGPATTLGNGPLALTTGDFDASGSLDVAVVNQTDESLTVLLNHGDATFAQAPLSPFAIGAGTAPTGLAAADFNGDGKPDIVVSNSGADSFSVFLNSGLGLFVFAIEPPAGTSPSAIIAAPLRGSTTSDVAITNNPTSGTGQVTVVLNASSFLGSNGVAQQPYPGSEYIDLGVKVKATPVLHANHEVTLQLEFEIRALAGANINGIPIISNRTLSQTVRVKEDEPTLLGGLTDREETRAITGLPGFASLPGIGYAFGTRNTSLTNTELVILITPRRLRSPGQTARSFYAGRGDTLPGRTEGGGPTPTTTPPQ
jgi:type II/III secretion system protein/VCBS repeat protein